MVPHFGPSKVASGKLLWQPRTKRKIALSTQGPVRPLPLDRDPDERLMECLLGGIQWEH